MAVFAAAPPPSRARLHTRVATCVLLVFAFTVLACSGWASTAAASPDDPNFGHKETICHATGNGSFVSITVDVAATGLQGGHANHSGDIIPAFTYVDKDGVTLSYAGKNLGTMYNGSAGAQVLANGCVVPPEDLCPNLDGVQETVPSGYTLENGICVQDNPNDVCPNLDGVQTSVPNGYTLENGVCVLENPDDVCPNLDGVQSSVPDGYTLEDGQCVVESADDLCPNLDGVQSSVPEGYEIENGDCVPVDTAVAGETESPESTTTTTTTTRTTTTGGAVRGAAAQPSGSLPYTGAAQEWMVLLGMVLIGAGLLLHLRSREGAAA
jgi:LPXTG-motif cell wall-anchored protein